MTNKDLSKFTIKEQRGQVSIFLAICMVLIFTLIAFVVNVGLFVKAKINLQNAVDAAAWSGAAVQARRLTNISHLNWEMRNTFKEWMFKYYVLGQNANKKTHNTASSKMDFRLKPFDPAATQADLFNLPSVCVHFGSSHNICNVYSVPGLPRFEVAGLPNVAEQFEAAIDTLVEQKAKNCIMRSIYNFMAASSYAYSTGENVNGNDVPVVAGYRVGSWIQAIELALRMRNLEYIVNQPPREDVCTTGCTNPITSLNNDNQALVERTSKAFFAAYKNLGGGKFKEQSSITGTFRLTELSPVGSNVKDASLSNLFIPASQAMARRKTYLNLIPMIFNYVTFFTTFSPSGNQSITDYGIDDMGAGTTAEGACTASKTAFPVPGYVMGFYKDPKIMTYYAVKGTANYIGLLNPFASGSNGIEMSAYAAAKPFGGRIGPRLVDPKGGNTRDSQANTPRNGPDNSQRTRDFILGFEPTAGFNDGFPIPPETGNDFYVSGTSNDENIGGLPENDGADVRFGIPNLIYQLPSSGTKLTGGDGTFIRKLKQYPSGTSPAQEGVGLFDGEQFRAFRNSLEGVGAYNGGVSFTDQTVIEAAIRNARKPTDYDAANYLIPTLRGHTKDEELESMPTLNYIGDANNQQVAYFAPLYGAGYLYNSRSSVETVVKDYLSSAVKPVEKYLDSLKDYSAAMIALNPTKYEIAAKGIYDPSEVLDSTVTEIVSNPLDCRTASMASKFNFLFRSQVGAATPNTCGMLPLAERLTQYIVGVGESGANRANFYTSTYVPNPDLDNLQVSTAYSPGLLQGATITGDMDSPFQNIQAAVQNISHKRNHYSTKLIPLRNVIQGIGADELQEKLMSEFEDSPDRMVNFIQTTELSEFLNPTNAIPGITDQGLEY